MQNLLPVLLKGHFLVKILRELLADRPCTVSTLEGDVGMFSSKWEMPFIKITRAEGTVGILFFQPVKITEP